MSICRRISDRGASLRCSLKCLALVVALLATAQAHAQVSVLSDPLNTSTSGTRSGGVLEAGGGWRVTGNADTIYWHIVPTITHGRYEYDIKGVSNSCAGCCYTEEPYTGQPFVVNELSHMYDWTYDNADVNYWGYRNNPFKHAIKRMCYAPPWTVKALWIANSQGGEEWAGHGLNWDANTTYRIAAQWVPTESGTEFKLLRDGQEMHSTNLATSYNPAGQSFKIGSGLRNEEGAYIGAVYSNVKFWDLSVPPNAPPIIQAVSPNPDTAWYGHAYSEQLVLLQGYPAPNWSLLQNPPGAQVHPVSGLVTGWTPSHGQIGQQVTFTARALNSQGNDTESWQVLVKAKSDFDLDGDCDQNDFGIFQVCLSGAGVAPPAGCEDADFDGNNDVSESDVETFRQCFVGPNIPVEAHCAD